MKVIETGLPGCVVIEPAVFGDERGYFYEGWNAARFAEHGLPTSFVQHNVSRSQRGVLRGLHYQWPGNVQGWSACWKARFRAWIPDPERDRVVHLPVHRAV